MGEALYYRFAEKLYEEATMASNSLPIRETEKRVAIEGKAHAAIQGMSLAQYLMVCPFIEAMEGERIPKSEIRKIFRAVWNRIGDDGLRYFETVDSDKQDTLDQIVYRNRCKLKAIGIPEEQWHKYGGKYTNK